MGVHDGHRDRLRSTFIEHGLDSFSELNTLELLLFYTRQRADTNPLAHALLDRFGSLSGVLNASFEELLEVNGIGENSAALIKLLPEIVKKAAGNEKRLPKQITNPDLAAEVLIPKFMFEEDEIAILLCLDANKRVIKSEEISRGVVNSVDLSSRRIAELALRSKASSVILSHNHPDGSLTPSTSDINTTKQLAQSLALLGIKLDDHIIIAGNAYSSLCTLGYL